MYIYMYKHTLILHDIGMLMCNVNSTAGMREGTGHAVACHERCHSGGGFLQTRCFLLAASSRCRLYPGSRRTDVVR